MIEKIEGRVADFLVTPENELVSGVSLTDHFAGHIPGIDQMQIIQEKIDLLNLRIVKNDTFGKESKDKIEKLITDFFGKNMRFNSEFVNKIQQGRSGKYRFTICKVKHDLI